MALGFANRRSTSEMGEVDDSQRVVRLEDCSRDRWTLRGRWLFTARLLHDRASFRFRNDLARLRAVRAHNINWTGHAMVCCDSVEGRPGWSLGSHSGTIQAGFCLAAISRLC